MRWPEAAWQKLSITILALIWSDPSQDNFIKCRNTPMFVVNIIFGHFNVRPDRDGAHLSPDRERIWDVHQPRDQRLPGLQEHQGQCHHHDDHCHLDHHYDEHHIQAVLSQEVEDDQRWLKYWILVSVFLTLQMPGDWVLGWAPGFSLAKIAFLLWCMAPIQENGSVILFQKVRKRP